MTKNTFSLPSKMPRKFSLFDSSSSVAVVAIADYLPISGDSSKPKKPISLSLLHRHPTILLIILPTLSFLFCLSGLIFVIYAFVRPIPTFRCGRVEDTLRPYYSLPNAQRVSGTNGVVRNKIKFVGLVGVQTGFGSGDRRRALRSTWFPSHPHDLLRLEQATGLAFRFVIGRTKDATKMAELEKEIEKYNDFLILDIEEEYKKLKYKTLAYFKAAFQLFEADYYVKADDDIYLRPDRLATLLAKERTHALTYIGCMKKGHVITNPKIKWYEKSANVIGSEYFLHAYGPIYVLSAGVVASLAVARNNSLRMFNNEDVSIGSWMLAMNVQHEFNRAICDPQCTSTSIAVWDIPKCSGLCNPATRMKQLHNISMCSQSPTLPPDRS
ncbi:putative beta-1,3-galactosyltransferase 12 isoform X2 [Apium graveolens]|uniref:putative beta-1,3-galactosyltransferase 12 isoform X2 n=1 Tax=Apium graveolens TaxID=4045 RepID=UPI003D7A0080